MLVHPQTRERASTTHRMRQVKLHPQNPCSGVHMIHILISSISTSYYTFPITQQYPCRNDSKFNDTWWRFPHSTFLARLINASIYHTPSPFLPPTATPCPSPGDRITAQAPLLEKVGSRGFKELRRSSTRFSIHHPLVHQNLGHPWSWEPLGKICRLVYCFGDLWFSAAPSKIDS